MEKRSRVVPGLLIGGLLLAGGGSVLAASGGSSAPGSAAKAEYCPPNSPNGGQPQGGPNNNCGNPPDKCPNGQPKPPNGNCGNPQGPPENPPGKGKKKKARFHVKRKPAKRCYSNKFVMQVRVVNRAKGGKTTVKRDGRKIKTTGRNKFTIRVNVRKLKPGVHKIKLRVKGKDGKFRTRTIKFRRC